MATNINQIINTLRAEVPGVYKATRKDRKLGEVTVICVDAPAKEWIDVATCNLALARIGKQIGKYKRNKNTIVIYTIIPN